MLEKRTSWAIALLCLSLSACSRNANPATSLVEPFPQAQTESIDSIAQAYVRVAVALGERDPDSLDFAAVSPDITDTIHRAYPSLLNIDREAARVLALTRNLSFSNEQQPRARFIERQLQAAQARIRTLQGHPFDFTAEAHVLFGTEPLPDDQAEKRILLLRRIASMLPPQPGLATPAARYAAFDKHFLIPPDRLPAVMTAALDACRQQTLTYLPLPVGESVDLTFVRNQPWSAFSRFHGHANSTIAINVSFPLTVDQALELACHEGYPGHHVFNTLRDIALVQQKHWPEAEVQLTFSPQSYLSESAAAFAPHLAFTIEERIHIERDILFPLAGLPPTDAERYVTISSLVRQIESAEPPIAQQYLDGQLEFVRAAQQLQQQMLMEHPEATLLYLNQFRSYMLAYTDGPRRIAAYIHSATADRPTAWRLYRQLIEDPSPTLPNPEQKNASPYAADNNNP